MKRKILTLLSPVFVICIDKFSKITKTTKPTKSTKTAGFGEAIIAFEHDKVLTKLTVVWLIARPMARILAKLAVLRGRILCEIFHGLRLIPFLKPSVLKHARHSPTTLERQ